MPSSANISSMILKFDYSPLQDIVPSSVFYLLFLLVLPSFFLFSFILLFLSYPPSFLPCFKKSSSFSSVLTKQPFSGSLVPTDSLTSQFSLYYTHIIFSCAVYASNSRRRKQVSPKHRHLYTTLTH